MNKKEKRIWSITLIALSVILITSMTINIITHAGLLSISAVIGITASSLLGISRIIIDIRVQRFKDKEIGIT